jgi:SAM-dependent methyltransferase
MPIPPNCRSSATSPTAGGIPNPSSSPCTTSTRCAWTGSTAAVGLAESACWTSAAAAASCRNPWRRAAPGDRHRPLRQGARRRPPAPLRKRPEVEYRHIRAEDMAQRCPASFDVVTCMEMLEHVPDPASTISACARLVKPGRQGLFLHPQPQPEGLPLRRRRRRIRAQPAARGTHEYAKFIKPGRTGPLRAAKPACDVEELIGMTYNPFTKTYALGRDTDVNYLMRTALDWRRCLDAVFSTSTARWPTPPPISAVRSTGCAPKQGSPLPRRPAPACLKRRARPARHRFRPRAGRPALCIALRSASSPLRANRCAWKPACFDGIAELLDSLEAQGIKWGVVTNKASATPCPGDRRLGLARRAACVVGGDTTPRQARPDPLLLASSRRRRSTRPLPLCRRRPARHPGRKAAGMGAVAARYGYLGDGLPILKPGAPTHHH